MRRVISFTAVMPAPRALLRRMSNMNSFKTNKI